MKRLLRKTGFLKLWIFVETDYFLDKKKLKNENKKSISLKDMFNEAIDFDNYEVEYKFDLPKEDDLSEILFTTGTTGKSKGIKIVYRNNVAIAQNVSEAIGITNDDVEMVTAPMNHSMALRRTYTVFYKGGTVVLTDGVKFY